MQHVYFSETIAAYFLRRRGSPTSKCRQCRREYNPSRPSRKLIAALKRNCLVNYCYR